MLEAGLRTCSPRFRTVPGRIYLCFRCRFPLSPRRLRQNQGWQFQISAAIAAIQPNPEIHVEALTGGDRVPVAWAPAGAPYPYIPELFSCSRSAASVDRAEPFPARPYKGIGTFPGWVIRPMN